MKDHSINDNVKTLVSQVAKQQRMPGFSLGSYFYHSELAYRLELEQLLFKSWIYAAHISEIPKSGDYVLFDVGQDSIIISHDDQGEIRALHNICRHRGSRVCEKRSGNSKTFVCPYHGWVYDNNGALRTPRASESYTDFEKTDYGLKKVALQEYMGLLFINFNPDAESFVPALDLIAKPLAANDLANAKVAHQKTYTVDANWKLCLENYLECYHCASSHKFYSRSHSLKELDEKVEPLNRAMLARTEQITGVQGIGQSLYKVYGDALSFGACVSHMRYALYEGYETGSEDGKGLAPLMGSMQGYDGGAGDFQMGPVTFMLNYPDHCVLYRFIPKGLKETEMKVVWFVQGDAQEGIDYDLDSLTWLWHETTQEDEYIVKRNSAGVNSSFYEPGPYHPEFEALCMKFVSWYLNCLVSDAP